jgi:Tol biopolymer transport system component
MSHRFCAPFTTAAACIFTVLIPSSPSSAQSPANVAQRQIAIELASGAPKSLQFISVPTVVATPQTSVAPDGNTLAYCHPVGDGSALTMRDLQTNDEKDLLLFSHGSCTQVAFASNGSGLFYTIRSDPAASQTAYRLPLPSGHPAFVAHDVETRITVSPQGDAIAFGRKDLASGNFLLIAAQTDGSGERVIARPSGKDTILPTGPAWAPTGTEIIFVRHDPLEGNHLFVLNIATGHMRQIGGSLWNSVAEICWLMDNSGLAIMGQGPFVAGKVSTNRPQLWYLDYPSGHVRQLTEDAGVIWSLSAASGGGALFASVGRPQYSVTVEPLAPPNVISAAQSSLRLDLPLPPLCQHEPVTWISDAELGFLCQPPVLGRPWEVITIPASFSGGTPALGEPKPLHCPEKSPRLAGYPSVTEGSSAKSSGFDEDPSKTLIAMLPPCLANGHQAAFALQSVLPSQVALKTSGSSYPPVRGMQNEGARAAALSPDGSLIATFGRPDAHGVTSIHIFSSKGGQVLTTYPIPSGSSIFLWREAIRWAPDGSAVAYLLRDKSTNLWEQPVDVANPLHSPPPVQVTHMQEGVFSGFDISPDSKHLALNVTLDRPEVIRIVGFR